MGEQTTRQYGVWAGYRNRPNLPNCPHDLWVQDADGRRVRNPERDEWLAGFFVGQRLFQRHDEELRALVETVNTTVVECVDGLWRTNDA